LNDLENDIIFPIHRPGHWLLSVISKTNETINIIDPFYNDLYDLHFQTISQWYRNVQIKLGYGHLPPTSWKKKLHIDYRICKQTDGTSCGVLAFFTAAYYMTTGGEFPNATDNYSQSDICELRWYMQYILFHIKEVQSTIVLDEDEEEDDEMRQVLRAIELSQREKDQEALSS
jgi:Ulp1 family protease